MRGKAVVVMFAIAGAGRAQGTPETVGAWSPVVDWGMSATHAHLRPDGKVLWWPEFDDGDNPFVWDPVTETNTPVPKAGYNIFCSGHAWTEDGRLFVAGGHIDNNVGLDYASFYDPASGSWPRVPNMNAGRWYPSVTTLPNGDMLVLAGTIDPKAGEDPLPQVWEMAQSRWRDLTGATLRLPHYPFTFVAPNGTVFVAGPVAFTRYLDTSGTGAWTYVGMTRYGRTRRYGSAVMYDDGKILIVGGGPANELPTDTAEVIDLNAAAPAWRSVGSMHRPRRQLNTTLLPDGKVLVNGGHGSGANEDPKAAVLETELWDPATEQFSLLAPATAFRAYHSTALLLPDARVLFAGGNKITTAQVFSPPYLFNGPRPEISSAPEAIGYGQTFTVGTPNAEEIATVTLLRIGSVTHSFNMNQRIFRPAFSAAAGELTITAPPSAALAPPGHYMLFILNGNGVPSVARIIHLGAPMPGSSTVPGAPGSRPGSPPTAGAIDGGGEAQGCGCGTTEVVGPLCGAALVALGIFGGRRRRSSPPSGG
jgi:galactose oxidase